jgi:hypothetical protein
MTYAVPFFLLVKVEDYQAGTSNQSGRASAEKLRGRVLKTGRLPTTAISRGMSSATDPPMTTMEPSSAESVNIRRLGQKSAPIAGFVPTSATAVRISASTRDLFINTWQ